MVGIDFGITVRPTPHGGTLAEMMRANDRILQAATEHDLTCWVIDHFQFDADPIDARLADHVYTSKEAGSGGYGVGGGGCGCN